MNRRVRQVFCAIKEHSSISYAKMATVGGFCDINLIIVKATAPDDFPLQEKYIQELLKMFSFVSSSFFHSFSISFTHRFEKTHCWKVALKCLLLLHRLLRSLPESSPFRTDLLWARSNGLLCLHPCHFRDDSSSNPGDYTNFIRSYAHLLDEALSCFTTLEGKEDEDETTPMSLKDTILEVNRLLEVLPQLQSIIDRVMDCMPTGAAARSFLVHLAMKHIIRDSFICYSTFRKDIVLVLDNLLQMPYRSSILAFGIYKKAALQADQLCEFYNWCKTKVGLCGAYEYPFIDRIPQIQIRALETFLNGMWQLTEEEGSSSTPTSPTSNKSSTTWVEDDQHDHGDKQLVVARELEVKGSHEEEMAPLIQLEDGENDVNWEDLLEASVDLRRSNYWIYPPNYRDWKLNGNVQQEEENNQLQLQVYNPYSYAFNPFCQPYYIVYCGNPESFNQPHYLVGSIPNNPWSF